MHIKWCIGLIAVLVIISLISMIHFIIFGEIPGSIRVIQVHTIKNNTDIITTSTIPAYSNESRPNNKHHEKATTFEELLHANASCQEFVHFWHELNYNFRLQSLSKTSTNSAAFPIYDYAYYSGQGYGRVYEHSVCKCILGISLNRPCLIDLDARDGYYVWRSFINIGTYDWNTMIDPIISNVTRLNIQDAIRQLPSQGSGQWEKQLVYDDIVPLTSVNYTKENITNVVNSWNANNIETRGKILIDPNWGSSWFLKHDINKPWNDAKSPCHMDELRTLIQNALYAPTILAKKIHQADRDALLNETIYGAVHIRRAFLGKTTDEQLSNGLKKCLNDTMQLFAGFGIEKWWFVGDNVDSVKNITKDFENVYHLYTDEFIANKSGHSLRAGGKYTHISVEGSVRDWMVMLLCLHRFTKSLRVFWLSMASVHQLLPFSPSPTMS